MTIVLCRGENTVRKIYLSIIIFWKVTENLAHNVEEKLQRKVDNFQWIPI